MADELARLWEGFKLTKTEKEVVDLTKEETKRVDLKSKRCLLLFVLMEKKLNNEVFKATMTKIWNSKGYLSFNEIRHHIFLIEFHKPVDMERGISGRPWTFDKYLVCIQPFDNSNP